ncbi:hypothetical protein V5799_015988 [Amblyomma americanum]|uniref:Uncharacterized protein n=1 Tax=Amblyomma americanum TaxID=6943 RepID=A0AAQ4F6D7_AMBAM
MSGNANLPHRDVDGSQDNCHGSSEDETLIQALDSSVPEWFWKTSARASGAASRSVPDALGATRPAIEATSSTAKRERDDDERGSSTRFEEDEPDDVAETLGIVYERPTSNKPLEPRQATCPQVGSGRRPVGSAPQAQGTPAQALPPPQVPASAARRQPLRVPAASGDGEDAGNRCDEDGVDDELATLRKTLLMEQIRAAREQARAYQAVASAAQAVRDSVTRAVKSRVHTEKIKRRKLALQIKKMSE